MSIFPGVAPRRPALRCPVFARHDLAFPLPAHVTFMVAMPRLNASDNKYAHRPCRSSVSPCEQSEQRVSPLRGKVLRANEQSEQSPRLTFARNRFGEALPPFARLLALLAAFFPLGRAVGGFARLLATRLASGRMAGLGLCSFARNAMTGMAKVRQGDGEGSAGPKRNETMRQWIIC